MECVGTADEMRLALYLCLKREERAEEPIPRVLFDLRSELLEVGPGLTWMLGDWQDSGNLPLWWQTRHYTNLGNEN